MEPRPDLAPGLLQRVRRLGFLARCSLVVSIALLAIFGLLAIDDAVHRMVPSIDTLLALTVGAIGAWFFPRIVKACNNRIAAPADSSSSSSGD